MKSQNQEIGSIFESRVLGELMLAGELDMPIEQDGIIVRDLTDLLVLLRKQEIARKWRGRS